MDRQQRLRIAVQKSGPPDRRIARPAASLRAEVQPRQGPADVLRREHAARRAVRARRRHPGPRAGRRLRPRARRLERARGKAARHGGARHAAAASRCCRGSISAAAAWRSPCREDFAVRRASRSIAGKRIATTYPYVLARFLRENSIEAQIVTLSGAVEIAPRLGRADLICDLVSTGSTLTANHLHEVAARAREPGRAGAHAPARCPTRRPTGCAACWSASTACSRSARASTSCCMRRARRCRRSRRLLPGSESPTVIPLDGAGDKVAVHAVCRETVFWETLESLKAAGASAVLVLPVEKMLA